MRNVTAWAVCKVHNLNQQTNTIQQAVARLEEMQEEQVRQLMAVSLLKS